MHIKIRDKIKRRKSMSLKTSGVRCLVKIENLSRPVKYLLSSILRNTTINKLRKLQKKKWKGTILKRKTTYSRRSLIVRRSGLPPALTSQANKQ